jgi:hypothetical protein
MTKPMLRGGAYVAALALCQAAAGCNHAAELAMFIVAAAAIELLLPVVAAEHPHGVRTVAGLRSPALSSGRLAALLLTVSALAATGFGLVFSAIQAASRH